MNRIPRRRAGFTLIELLVVVLIIGILIALLLPAINGAVRSAKNASVTSEINQLAGAMESFKTKYGDYPPSRIALNEHSYYNPNDSTPLSNSSADMLLGQLNQRTVKYMRKFFPRATQNFFRTDTTGASIDYNNNGTLDTNPFLLDGSECLVFFLGGMANVTSSPNGAVVFSLTGFSSNPLNPFDRNSTNRAPAFFEFPPSRLVDIDGDGFPSFLDPLATNKAYAYFASYGASSYDPNDVNFTNKGVTEDKPTYAEADGPQAVQPIARAFRVNFVLPSGGLNSAFPATGTGLTDVAVSPPPNPYTGSLAVPLANAAGAIPAAVYQKPETYQIISAGLDGLYGAGGSYDPTSTSSRLPSELTWGATSTQTMNTSDSGVRLREADNLSNFASSKLD